MADKKVRIIITGKDEASQAFKSVDNSLLSIAKTVAGVAIAFKAIEAGTKALVDLAKGAWDLAQAAAPIPGISNAFATMGGNIEKMRRATMGMVSDRDLMLRYNEAAQLVSQTFAQTLPEAMQMLTKVSRATGRDLDYLMSSYVTAVGRGSKLIADNMAITVDWERANEDMAASLGKTVDQLTEQEIQTARSNHVLELLRENTAKLPDAAGTAQQSFGTLQSTLDNLRDAAGVKLLGPMGDLAAMMTVIAQDAGPKLIATLEDVVTGAGPLFLEWLRDVAKAIPPVLDWFLKFMGGTRLVSQTIFEGSKNYQDYYNKILQCPRALDLFKADMDKAEVATALMSEGLLLSADAFDRLKFGLDESSLRLEVTGMKMASAKVQTEALAEGMRALAVDTDAATDAMAGMLSQRVAEDNYFRGGSSVVYRQGLAERVAADKEAAKEAGKEAIDTAADTAREAARAASEAYNQEMQKVRMKEAKARLQETVAGLPAAFAEAADRMREALSGFKDYEAMAPGEFAPALENVVTLAGMAADRITQELQTLTAKYKDDILPNAAETANAVNQILGLLSFSGELRDLMEPAKKGAIDFEQAIKTYVWQMQLAGRYLMDWLRTVRPEWAEMLKLAGPIAEDAEKIFGLLGIDLADSVPVKDGLRFGININNYVLQLKYAGTKLMDWLRTIRPDWAIMLKTAGPIADDARGIFGLLGIDLAKSVPMKHGLQFAINVNNYLLQLEYAGARIMDWMRKIKPEYAKMLKQAAPIAEDAQKLFGLLGVDLSKVAGYKGTPQKTMDKVVKDMEILANALLDMANRVKGKIDKKTSTAITVLNEAFGGVKDALDTVLALAALRDPKTGKSLYQKVFKGGESDIWKAIRNDIERLVESISGWNLTGDMKRMKGVNVILTEAKSTIDMMVGMIQDINAVMEKGGLNVNAARALFSQFTNFLRMPGWIGGWQFGTPDTGSPTAGGNGTLAITINRMEVYAGDAALMSMNITGKAQVAAGQVQRMRLLAAGKGM